MGSGSGEKAGSSSTTPKPKRSRRRASPNVDADAGTLPRDEEEDSKKAKVPKSKKVRAYNPNKRRRAPPPPPSTMFACDRCGWDVFESMRAVHYAPVVDGAEQAWNCRNMVPKNGVKKRSEEGTGAGAGAGVGDAAAAAASLFVTPDQLMLNPLLDFTYGSNKNNNNTPPTPASQSITNARASASAPTPAAPTLSTGYNYTPGPLCPACKQPHARISSKTGSGPRPRCCINPACHCANTDEITARATNTNAKSNAKAGRARSTPKINCALCSAGQMLTRLQFVAHYGHGNSSIKVCEKNRCEVCGEPWAVDGGYMELIPHRHPPTG